MRKYALSTRLNTEKSLAGPGPSKAQHLSHIYVATMKGGEVQRACPSDLRCESVDTFSFNVFFVIFLFFIFHLSLSGSVWVNLKPYDGAVRIYTKLVHFLALNVPHIHRSEYLSKHLCTHRINVLGDDVDDDDDDAG